MAKVQELGERPVSGENFARIVAARCKVREVRDQQSAVAEAAPLKHARVEGGTERLGKWLHLPVHNDLAPTLASSLDAEVRAMEPTPVFGLLLVRSALTCIEAGRFTMWVDALDSAEDRRRQAALVEVFNTLGLRCRGSALLVHLRDRAVGSAA